MLARIAAGLTRFSSRWIPDAWVIAVLLTVVTGAVAAGVEGSVDTVLTAWGDGFWRYNNFAMQMCLIIMTGYMLSTAPPVKRLLEGVASLARGPRSAVALLAVISLLLGWINWGLSVAASAMLVRTIARRHAEVDYRLLVCAAYFGVATIWHAGLSGSAPLKVAQEGHELAALMGVVPVTDSIFHGFNLALSALILVLMPTLVCLMHPAPEETVSVDPARLADDDADDDDEEPCPARSLERSPLINVAVAAAMLWWLVGSVRDKGVAAVHLDSVNFTFLALAIALHFRPRSFLRAASESGRFVWGILIQFPFYAGIAGILGGTELSTRIAGAFEVVSTAATYPAFVLVYSGVLNYFVPSGGSQWIVSGQYIMEAAQSLGVGTDKALLAYAWGDMSTNLIQPFWAIPLLAIAGLRFRDIMGFAVLLFGVYFTVLIGAFLLLGAL